MKPSRTQWMLLVLAAAVLVACLPVIATDGTTAPAQPPRKISLLQAVILGAVQGVTEFLPVSSTGHLILTSHWMGLSSFSQEEAMFGHKLLKARSIDAFEVIIQLGSILAVLGLYRARVGQMCQGIVGRNPDGRRLMGLLIVAFLPAAIVGFVFRGPIQQNLFSPMTVAWALAVGGVLMIVVEYFFCIRKRGQPKLSRIDQMRYWQAGFIGLMQILAMWPGTSRSMITMLAALVVGLDMVAAAEFSFLLALPTLGVATAYQVARDWRGLLESAGWDGLLLGLLVSGVVAAVAVKVFVRWLTRHGLIPFGIYRILLAGAVYWYFLR